MFTNYKNPVANIYLEVWPKDLLELSLKSAFIRLHSFMELLP